MFCYLDNSATTRPRKDVIAAMDNAMADGFYNPASLYAPGLEADRGMDMAREAIARHLGPCTVTFTSGGTEANNLAILGHLRTRRGRGRVLYTAVEHPAVLESCRYAASLGYETVEVPVLPDGTMDLDALAKLATGDTVLIAVMQVNNEMGVIQPLDHVIAIRNRACPDALLHVDGVQGFLRLPARVSQAGINTYALSAHKLHGPKGVGALAVAPGTRLMSIGFGGGQEKGLRNGTPNTPGIAGLRCAIDSYPDAHSVRELKMRLHSKLRDAIPELTVNGPAPESPAACDHILNVSFQPVRSETMLHALEQQQVYVGVGSACSSRRNTPSHVLKAVGIPPQTAACAIRFSLSPMTTAEEIDYAAQCCADSYRQLKRFTRR